MRTLSATSRALCVAAAFVAAALILGGAYFAGYVSETQRDLSDPAALRHKAAAEIATIERALGYGGFLNAYRNYRLTGDPHSRPQLTTTAAAAARAIGRLRALYEGDPIAAEALREAAAVTDAFSHIARIAPQLGDAALRGSAAMDTLNSLPQSPQLEATYLSLCGTLDRLRQADLEHKLGGAASALSLSQMLIVGAIAFVVLGLIVVAGLLQLGIIQPLKALEHSLTSVGEGAVDQRIWGTDRKDEFGALARAGEKIRRGLAETGALKSLSDKGQIHLTLAGNASLVFEKLASDVTTATDALKSASADLVRLQDDGRRQFETAVRNLAQSGAGFEDTAKTVHQNATAALDDIRASAAKLADVAEKRAARLDEVANHVGDGASALTQSFAAAKEKAEAAASGLASSSVSLNRFADDARTIFNKISSDSAAATGKVGTLAAQLSDAVDAVDERLGQKLNALDNLEQHLSFTLDRVQQRADETLLALNAAAGERGAAAEARMTKSAADLEEVLRVFRDGAASIERFDAIAKALQTPAAATLRAPEFESFAKALQVEGETIRKEIRDLAIRLTEDRLLAGADMPFLATKADAEDAPPRRTLADVPGAEIMARLQSLAAEMNAAQDKRDHVAALQKALAAFASDVKRLAPNADRAARLKSLGAALDRHADEIETQTGAIDPSAQLLRSEVHAITSELRTIAARAQTNGVKEGPALREAAMHLGDRAEKMFDRFDHLPEPVDEPEAAMIEAKDPTGADLAALVQLIGRLEARAEQLARTAVASRFDAPNPAARMHGRADLGADGTITTVFESIERLNNVAAALARAGDAERLRRAAH